MPPGRIKKNIKPFFNTKAVTEGAGMALATVLGLSKSQAITSMCPTHQVLFISGYAESDFSDLLQNEIGVFFLPKPLDIKTRAERVKQELHGG